MRRKKQHNKRAEESISEEALISILIAKMISIVGHSLPVKILFWWNHFPSHSLCVFIKFCLFVCWNFCATLWLSAWRSGFLMSHRRLEVSSIHPFNSSAASYLPVGPGEPLASHRPGAWWDPLCCCSPRPSCGHAPGYWQMPQSFHCALWDPLAKPKKNCCSVAWQPQESLPAGEKKQAGRRRQTRGDKQILKGYFVVIYLIKLKD